MSTKLDFSDGNMSKIKTGPKVPLLPIPKANDFEQYDVPLSDEIQDILNINSHSNYY
jgi:hypothetical protein